MVAAYAFAFVVSIILAVHLLASLMSDSDPLPIFVHRIFGARIIWVDYQFGAPFKAVLRVDPWGEKYAYRYHMSCIGIVRLFDDGTAEYCGKARWIDVK